jgi:hypothetical protein
MAEGSSATDSVMDLTGGSQTILDFRFTIDLAHLGWGLRILDSLFLFSDRSRLYQTSDRTLSKTTFSAHWVDHDLNIFA